MHTLDLPQYAIIASLRRRGGDDGGARRHARWWRRASPRRSTSGARCARSTRSTARTGGSRSGARTSSPPTASAPATTGCCKRQREVARLRRPGRRLQPARPDQEHDHHAGARRVGQVRARPASRPRSSPSSSPSTASWSRRPGLYSFFIMFTIGITKGRWNTLLTALQQFKDDYDRNQPMWRILPEFCAAHPRYERMGLRDLCAEHPRDVRQGRHRAPDDRDVPVGPAAGDEAERRLRLHRAPQDRAGRRSTSSKAASRPRC